MNTLIQLDMNTKELILKEIDRCSNAIVEFENKREFKLIEYIEQIQNNNGFIKFTEETSFPYFNDTSIEVTSTIYGIKIGNKNEKKTILLYTDDNAYDEMNADDMKGWFDYKLYGDFSFEEVLECLMEYDSIFNK